MFMFTYFRGRTSPTSEDIKPHIIVRGRIFNFFLAKIMSVCLFVCLSVCLSVCVCVSVSLLVAGKVLTEPKLQSL